MTTMFLFVLHFSFAIIVYFLRVIVHFRVIPPEYRLPLNYVYAVFSSFSADALFHLTLGGKMPEFQSRLA